MVTTLDEAVRRCLQGVTTAPGDALAVRGELLFPPDFAAFAGHFPDQPVVPAIVQLVAVRLLAGQAVGQDLVPVAARRIKFRGMIRPDDPVTIVAKLQPHEDHWRAAFTVSRGGDTVATGSLDLAAA